MPYTAPYTLSENVGNNTFSYTLREKKVLIIPSLVRGTLDDVKIGKEVVFEEMENGILKSCIGLKNFIRLDISENPPLRPVTIFDNHNHALYFWYEALSKGIIAPGAELIHIDEHSDLWENTNTITSRSLEDIWKFVNYECNVGNYIIPALQEGIIKNIIRIENEYQLDEYINYTPPKNSILNLDLDFFAPEMNFIAEEKKLQCIRNLMKKVQCVTIATSPYFIDQGIAIEKLKKILMPE